MSESGNGPSTGEIPPLTGERVVYVMPAESGREKDYAEISLLELWNVLWQDKWLIIAVTAVFAILSVAYAFTATEWYHSDVLLAPAGESTTSGLARQVAGLGSLASFAGISVGDGENVEPIAIFTSRDFTRAFIEDKGLLPVLFADHWDAENGRWKTEDAADQPDIRDAIRYFSEEITAVSEDPKTSLVTISVQWTDPETAAEWANLLVARLNDYMRQRALTDAEANLAYLEEALSSTIVVTIRQSIGQLIETELKKLMLAKGNEEFAFRVIDSANIPKYRSTPKRKLIVALSVLMGGLISILLLFVWRAMTNNQQTS